MIEREIFGRNSDGSTLPTPLSSFGVLVMRRAATSPHGVSVSPIFFGTRPYLRNYDKEGNAIKIKTVDVHPVYPWVVTCDGSNTVTVWNYALESLVFTFHVDSVKGGQRGLIEALELHTSFAEALGVGIPDVAGPGMGVGNGGEPGATVGGAMEAFISERVAPGGRGGGRHQQGSHRSGILGGLPEEARSAKTGAVRSVQFADEHVLALTCGVARPGPTFSSSSSSSSSRGGTSHHHPPTPNPATLPMASTLEELEGLLSPHGSDPGCIPHPSWLMVLCEHRVILLDYATRACVDLPHASLLVENGGGGGLPSPPPSTSGLKPSVHSGALVGPGTLVFGCEDGALRVWSASAHAVVQVVKPNPASGGPALHRPITHCEVFTPLPSVWGGGPPLSSKCPLGGAAGWGGAGTGKTGKAFLLAGSSDGWVVTWEVQSEGVSKGFKGLVEAGSMGAGGAKGGVKLSGGDCTSIALCRTSLAVTATGGDKYVAAWDAVSHSGVMGGNSSSSSSSSGTPSSPQVTTQKITTSSTAAEGGVGSKLTVAFPLGGCHPLFPPSTLLVCGKGPHLELALMGGSCGAGAGAAGGSTAFSPDPNSGIIIYDLRTARPGLPQKVKVYTAARHPTRPDLFALGTNVGVFLVGIASAYTLGASMVSHPQWRLPPFSLPGGRVREGYATVSVSASGGLVVSEVAVASENSEGEEGGGGTHSHSHPSSSEAPSSGLSSLKGGGDTGGEGDMATPLTSLSSFMMKKQPSSSSPPPPAPPLLSITHTDTTLLPTLLPTHPPPTTMTPPSTIPNAPPPLHNAWAHLMALTKGCISGAGTRGVRLRLSVSGRYLAAVWPESKVYSLFKLSPPSPDSEGAGQGWGCEYLGGGTGVDLAWSSPMMASSSSSGSSAGNFGGGGGGGGVTVERFLVLEPGLAQTGRGPMGGGMSIGSLPPTKASSASASSAPPPKINFSPPTLSLHQIELLEDAHSDVPPPTLLANDIGLSSQGAYHSQSTAPGSFISGEPCALWGGPLLAVAIAPEGSGSSAGGAAVGSALASSALYFFSWEAVLSGGEEERKKTSSSSSTTTSAAASSKRPRMLPVGGGTSSVPCPSLAGSISGCGVTWAPCGSRLAISTPYATHVFAYLPPSRQAALASMVGIMPSPQAVGGGGGGGGGGGAGKSASPPPFSQGFLLELCRTPSPSYALHWLGGALVVSTTQGDGESSWGTQPRTLVLFPPVFDPIPYVYAASQQGGVGSIPPPLPNPMAPGGASHLAYSADILTLNPPSFSQSSLPLTSPFPPPTRGLLPAAGAVPLGLARGHLIMCHWVGPRKGITTTGMVATPHSLLSPAFKAGMALSSVGVWCGGGLLSASVEVSKLGMASIPSHVFAGSGSENVNSARVMGGGGGSAPHPTISASSVFPGEGGGSTSTSASSGVGGGGASTLNPFASLSMGGEVMRARTPPHTSYLEASRTAATLAAALPPSALAACASDWSNAGAITAALLLPNLPITLGISIALSTRPAVAALVTPTPTSPRHLSTQQQALNPLSRFSTLDAMVACSYLLSLLKDVSDEELWYLGGAAQGCSLVPSSSSSSSPISHHSASSPPWELEGSVNTLGVWPSVAILLALSTTGNGEVVGGGGGFPVASPRDMSCALADFSRRLSRVGLHRDALFVGAVSGGEPGGGSTLESPGFEVFLNSLTPSLSEAVRKLTEITTRP